VESRNVVVADGTQDTQVRHTGGSGANPRRRTIAGQRDRRCLPYDSPYPIAGCVNDPGPETWGRHFNNIGSMKSPLRAARVALGFKTLEEASVVAGLHMSQLSRIDLPEASPTARSGTAQASRVFLLPSARPPCRRREHLMPEKVNQ
jgi:hypothetical protein